MSTHRPNSSPSIVARILTICLSVTFQQRCFSALSFDVYFGVLVQKLGRDHKFQLIVTIMISKLTTKSTFGFSQDASSVIVLTNRLEVVTLFLITKKKYALY